MSYRVREWILTPRRLLLSDAEQAAKDWRPPPAAPEVRGPHPTLIDVFKRHPDWRTRTRALLKKVRG